MTHPLPVLDGVSHAFVEVATHITMHVASAGPEDGPPVVLLHGWPQHWWCWRGVMGPLADAGFRVHAPDLRGFGWSDAPAGGYDKQGMADDVLALLDALDLERVVLVGHDWGGWIAQLIAVGAPQRVERLVLCNIAPLWPGSRGENARNAWRLLYQPVMGAPAGLGARLQRNARVMGRVLDGVPPADKEEFLATLREPARAAAASQLYRTFFYREIPALVRGRFTGKRLTMPTLVIHGTDDPVIHDVSGFRDHADDVEIVPVPDTGHFVVDEQPALVAEHIRAFLRP